ncbi:arylamine N-acetyltransferase family protein [Paenibacillus lactis]|uniref:arylamine N-acetyltransferase family protein n=1 Tax=Paenibacillus lactis TaxID=228574 RepID=UPI00048FD295
MITDAEIKAYLTRLGIFDSKAPTKAFLFELHQAHVERISWQTVDIFAGKPTAMDVRSSIQLILSRRSGYCFHLNGAFGTLLQALGYKVQWHRAGVQPIGQEPRINGFHLGITVSLANDEGQEERWIVDVGLGDMPYEPIPLRYGTYRQGPFSYSLMVSGAAQGGWRLTHDPANSYVGIDYAPEVVDTLDVFAANHEFYSRSPESPWRDLFIVRQRSAKRIHEVKGRIWKSWDEAGIHTTEIASKAQWREVLADLFHEELVHYSELERDGIWNKITRLHERWLREMQEQNYRAGSI